MLAVGSGKLRKGARGRLRKGTGFFPKPFVFLYIYIATVTSKNLQPPNVHHYCSDNLIVKCIKNNDVCVRVGWRRGCRPKAVRSLLMPFHDVMHLILYKGHH